MDGNRARAAVSLKTLGCAVGLLQGFGMLGTKLADPINAEIASLELSPYYPNSKSLLSLVPRDVFRQVMKMYENQSFEVRYNFIKAALDRKMIADDFCALNFLADSKQPSTLKYFVDFKRIAECNPTYFRSKGKKVDKYMCAMLLNSPYSKKLCSLVPMPNENPNFVLSKHNQFYFSLGCLAKEAGQPEQACNYFDKVGADKEYYTSAALQRAYLTRDCEPEIVRGYFIRALDQKEYRARVFFELAKLSRVANPADCKLYLHTAYFAGGLSQEIKKFCTDYCIEHPHESWERERLNGAVFAL